MLVLLTFGNRLRFCLRARAGNALWLLNHEGPVWENSSFPISQSRANCKRIRTLKTALSSLLFQGSLWSVDDVFDIINTTIRFVPGTKRLCACPKNFSAVYMEGSTALFYWTGPRSFFLK